METVVTPDFTFDPEKHEYRYKGQIIPGATDILKSAGFQYPEGNMEKGRAIHLATAYDDRGILKPESVTDEVFPFLESYRKFRRDTGFKPDRIEEPNVNPMLMFAATLDREGTMPGQDRRILLELKKFFPPFFTALQLSLQDLTLPKLAVPRDRIAVELKETGGYAIHRYTNPGDKNMAISLVGLYWYKKNGGCL